MLALAAIQYQPNQWTFFCARKLVLCGSFSVAKRSPIHQTTYRKFESSLFCPTKFVSTCCSGGLELDTKLNLLFLKLTQRFTCIRRMLGQQMLLVPFPLLRAGHQKHARHTIYRKCHKLIIFVWVGGKSSVDIVSALLLGPAAASCSFCLIPSIMLCTLFTDRGI